MNKSSNKTCLINNKYIENRYKTSGYVIKSNKTCKRVFFYKRNKYKSYVSVVWCVPILVCDQLFGRLRIRNELSVFHPEHS